MKGNCLNHILISLITQLSSTSSMKTLWTSFGDLHVLMEICLR